MGSGGEDRRRLKMIRDKSHGVEKLLKDRFSMDSGGQGISKEKKKIRGRLGTKKDTATVPRQWRRKAVGYFSVMNKSASAWILL